MQILCKSIVCDAFAIRMFVCVRYKSVHVTCKGESREALQWRWRRWVWFANEQFDSLNLCAANGNRLLLRNQNEWIKKLFVTILCAPQTNKRKKNHISIASLEITWEASRSTLHRTNTNIDRMYFWNLEQWTRQRQYSDEAFSLLALPNVLRLGREDRGENAIEISHSLRHYVRNPQAIRQKESLGENSKINAAWPQSLRVNQKRMRAPGERERTKEKN